jgi:hypothetical protein
MIKSFPTLTAAKQYGDFFQLDSHTRYAIYLIHNFGNCTGNNLGYYTGTIGLQGDIYVPGHVPTINGEVKLYKTFARAKQGAQAIYNKCGYVQKFEIHTIEIRANDKAEKECDKGHWIDITFDASMCSVCQTTQNTKLNTARSAGLKWTVIIVEGDEK